MDVDNLDGEDVSILNAGGRGGPSLGSQAPRSEPPDPIRSAFVMAVRVLEAGRASLLLRRDAQPRMGPGFSGDRLDNVPLPPVLTMVAAVGIEPSLVESIRVPLGQGMAGIVAEKGLSLLGRSVTNQTFVIAPVISHAGIEGVLSLTDRLGGRQYTSADLASSTFVAGHIADLLEYRRQAMIDTVTGLPNRRAFDEALERELARASRAAKQFSVVFLDVDELKAVNDRAGHAAGDELLRNVGRALLRETRQYDFAARIGGDEFGVQLADTKEDQSSLARRISTRMESIGYSLSVGIARYPEDGRTARELLEAADKRMYEDKRAHSPRSRSNRQEPDVP
jgi:diguanylate cyclase (GGDEF)-like protein